MSSSSSSEVSLEAAGVDGRFLRRFESGFEQTMRETGEIRTVLLGGEDVGSVWIELRRRTLHLHALVLEPAARGSGVGGRVLAQLEREYRGRADELELGVQRGNEAARRLYEKSGPTEVESPHAALGFQVLRRALDA